MGIFILSFAFISTQNSLSLTNSDIERVGLFDNFCKNNAICNLFPQTTHPQTTQQIEKNLTSDNANQTMLDPALFLTYSNKSLGLEIQHPVWLDKIELPKGVEFVFPNKNAGAVLANSSIESGSGNNSTNRHLLYLNKSLDNLNILNTSRSDVMGYPTTRILFTYDNDTELYKGMQFWNIKDDHARQFTYFAPAEGVFDELLPTIDRMSKTIKVS